MEWNGMETTPSEWLVDGCKKRRGKMQREDQRWQGETTEEHHGNKKERVDQEKNSDWLKKKGQYNRTATLCLKKWQLYNREPTHQSWKQLSQPTQQHYNQSNKNQRQKINDSDRPNKARKLEEQHLPTDTSEWLRSVLAGCHWNKERIKNKCSY